MKRINLIYAAIAALVIIFVMFYFWLHHPVSQNGDIFTGKTENGKALSAMGASKRTKTGQTVKEGEKQKDTGKPSTEWLYIDVKGQVEHPGGL